MCWTNSTNGLEGISMIEMPASLSSLLGLKLDIVARSRFARSLGEQPTTELIEDRFYMEFRESGVLIDADLEGDSRSIFFFAEGHQGYKGFAGCLPDGVTFSDSRSDVRNRLGTPTASGEGGSVPVFGTTPAWDRFDKDAYSLHLQYADDFQSVTQVTVMRPDSVPR